MLNFLVGLFSFLSGACLALAVHLNYKDKIAQLKEDWLAALRTQRDASYREGYKHGMTDEKIVQAAQKHLSNLGDVTLIIPAQKPPKFDDITLIMDVVK